MVNKTYTKKLHIVSFTFSSHTSLCLGPHRPDYPRWALVSSGCGWQALFYPLGNN